MIAPSGHNQGTPQPRGNARVVLVCLGALGVMGGVTAYSPTLYRIFCQATGYGGTTQRANKAPAAAQVLDRVVTVRFDANVSPHLAWKFEPVQNTMDVKIGETALAYFRATNTSDKPLKGQASFNVTPEIAGVYFNKIECFCFKEQTLQPGQSADMPVTFFIDPAMAKDRDLSGIGNITLSYVFFPVENKSAARTNAAPDGRGG
jgi:cytochrome c oxidase assembly protein subunit 11